MRKKLYALLLLSLTANFLYAQQLINGRIHCENKGIAEVVVTDGRNVTKTNSKGYYKLFVDGAQSYVYYSLPKHYESPLKNGIPVFYKEIVPHVDRYDFEIKKSVREQHKHTFVVWADPQIIDPEEFQLLEKVIDDIKGTQDIYNTSFHGISCGDIVFDRLNFFDNYKNSIGRFDFPFYQVLGNHDMDYSNETHESSRRSYQKAFGPDYYSFNIGNIHYIVLNDVFYYGYAYHYMGYIDGQQLEWLKKDLAQVAKGTTVMIALHIPTMYTDADTRPNMEKRQKNSLINNKAFYECLKGYNVHILAGHSHTQWNTVINDSITEHTHAAASAAWWQGEVGLDGTPKGYTVYEVDGNDIKWYFKGVGIDKDEQLKIYPVGTDAEHPTAFVANVFNYDPLWKVEWYENDVLKGDMEQYWGVDPLAKSLYAPGKNKKYSWLSYDHTNHLFKAVPADEHSQIKVVVTDRFGQKYTRTISEKKNNENNK
ncbi:calcineurin-like phosphoesterase C-terminal domain-containing protein [Bacteroides graminisolvens]|jgi:hypothetical protein|uniref:Serine/threonine protein phosphatase n=1 Tax=Bacteroides graminisolvens DSM 19988 = JCM 15093 TaxID=1121097 RepID=A0A069D228_9BACE|nr:calcineurin-like phosphoesterase family protein [Bacteroides graminisolvens]GAK36385.1 hypothetical protein JCM15093_1543 [Bacteroides graminisolvens DSM 19988 = JCM 15093]